MSEGLAGALFVHGLDKLLDVLLLGGVAAEGNELEAFFVGGFHQPVVHGPELLKLVVEEAQPQLVVVLFLHRGHYGPSVLQDIGLFYAG